MGKPKKFRRQEPVALDLQDLQGLRDASKGPIQKRNIQAQIDNHFMPPKPPRKKKEKKKRFYKERN